MEIITLIGDYKAFIADLLQKIKSAGIDIETYPIDHLCYRTATTEEYSELKNKLMQFSRAYIENTYHDRPISKFILKTPLLYNQYSISMLELPAPKKDIKYSSGLEHFEMVVDDFIAFQKKYKNLWSGSDDSNIYNETVYITFENNKTVKFHEYSLEEVLKKEGRQFIKLNQ